MEKTQSPSPAPSALTNAAPAQPGAHLAKNHVLTPRARNGKITVLRCACHNLPFAEIDFERAVLRIVSRHRGELCQNTIPLLDLKGEALSPKRRDRER